MSSDFFKKFEGQIESMGKDGIIGIMKSAHLEINKTKNNKQKNNGDIRGMLKLHSSFDDWNEMYKNNKNRPNQKKLQLIKSKENIKTEGILFINKKFNNKSKNSIIQEVFRSPPSQKRQILKPPNNLRKEEYPDRKRNNKVSFNLNNNLKILQSKTISNKINQNNDNLILPTISPQKKKKTYISLRPLSQTKSNPTKILSKRDNDILQKVKKESQYIQEISKKSQQLLITTDFRANSQRKSSIPNNKLPSLIINHTNQLQPIQKQTRNFPNTSPSISQHLTLDIIKEEEEYDQDEEENEYKPYIQNRYNINSNNTPTNDIELLMQQRLSYQHFLPFNSKFKIKN